MSLGDRVKMVVVAALGAAGILGLLLTMEGHPNTWPWAAAAGIISGGLVTLAVWPRR